LFQVVADSTTWTAEEVAAARDRRTLLRSEQRRSKSFWKNASRDPVEMSVPVAMAAGPCLSRRSRNVAPSNRISPDGWFVADHGFCTTYTRLFP
jgi:hypothetical protein